MSNPTTPFGWQMPTATDLVTDLPADFEVFGQAVATSMADLLGGTTGQVLAKTSATDMDFTWTTPQVGDITGVTAGVGISGGGTSGTVTVTNDMATTITTAGDLIYGTGSGTYTRRGIGTTGQMLTVASGVPTWSSVITSGLTLIKTQTIGTGVTSVAVTNVFSSTYDNYLITVSGGVLSANANMGLQLGATTSGYYEFGIYGIPSSATVNGVTGNNVALFQYVASGSSTGVNGVMTLLGPNLAKPTAITYQSMRPTNRVYTMANGTEDSTTQHTDFTLKVDSSANATGGTIKVYGYVNS